MHPFVGLTLSALRIAANATFYLELQRVIFRIIRPTRRDAIVKLESKLLQQVTCHIQHLWLKDSSGYRIHVIQAKPSRTLSSSMTHSNTNTNTNTNSNSNSNSNKPVIVLLHGHSMCAAYWYRNLDDLTNLGYTVYAIDLLGWGRSHRPQFQGKTADDSASWYVHSLHSTIEQLTPNKIILIGHSLGAYIAFEYSRLFQTSIHKLVLLSPAACVRNVPLRRALYFSLTPQAVIRRGGLLGFLLFHLQYPRNNLSYTKHHLTRFTYHLANQYPPSGETAIRPIIKFHKWNQAQCIRPLIELVSQPPIHVPTLVVCGDSDTSISVLDVETFYKHMKASNHDVQFKMIDNCDHCPQLERPKQFFNSISNFIQPM